MTTTIKHKGETMDTKKEVKRLIDGGMTQLDKENFLSTLSDLGYKTKESFNYINNLNEITYKAKSFMITEINTGLSFANIDARRDKNFKRLQQIRFDSFVYSNNTIWEL